jgi:hypothetical protein
MCVLNVEIKCDDSMLELKCVLKEFNLGVNDMMNDEINEVLHQFLVPCNVP